MAEGCLEGKEGGGSKPVQKIFTSEILNSGSHSYDEKDIREREKAVKGWLRS
jgi:hypothetical protein